MHSVNQMPETRGVSQAATLRLLRPATLWEVSLSLRTLHHDILTTLIFPTPSSRRKALPHTSTSCLHEAGRPAFPSLLLLAKPNMLSPLRVPSQQMAGGPTRPVLHPSFPFAWPLSSGGLGLLKGLARLVPPAK